MQILSKMHNVEKTGLCIFFFFLFCISAFSNSPDAYTSDKHDGTLVYATTSDPKSFNPIVAKETSTTEVTNLLFEGLTKVNGKTIEIEPNLASSWTVDESGKEWIFNLRRDVLWSDGERFDADDVLFTFNDLIFNPEIPASARDIFTIDGKKIDVQKIDDWTVRFVLPAPFAPFLMAMSQIILPEHKLKKYVSGNTFDSAWGINTDTREIVGTGPFVLERYFPMERVVFKRNELYWKKDASGASLPFLKNIIILIVQNQDVELLKFQQGEIDYYSMRGSDFAILKPQEQKGEFTLYRPGPAFGSNFIIFNQNTRKDEHNKTAIPEYKLRWFRDPAFRKAVSFALDRDALIDIVLSGLGTKQYAPMSPSAGFFYNPDVMKYPYDKEKAKELLGDAGYIDRDNDGYLEDAEGNKIAFSLMTNADNTVRNEIAKIVRKDLQNIGMDVNLVAIEFNTLVAKLTVTYDWEAILLGLTGGIEPHFGKNVWDSSAHLHAWFPRQEEPQTEWEKRIDAIFDAGVQEIDPEKRKKLYDEWQYIASEQLPLIYTVIPERLVVLRNRFGNVKPSAYGGVLHNIEELYVLPGKKKQK